MKQINSLLIFLLFGFSVFGQAPNKMSFQAVIRKSADELVENRQVSMRISILQGSANGLLVYSETHRPTTNENGLVSLEIGGGIVLSGNFSSIPWSAGPYFIKTETDVKGGRNYTISGISQLLSVPYALYAEKAGTTTAGTIKNQMMYWTGASWSTLNPGKEGQELRICNGRLVWTDGYCPGLIKSLKCQEILVSGILKRNIFNDGVTIRIPYSGGNGAHYKETRISSTGVKGFSASISEGDFSYGDGVLYFNVNGASQEVGEAIFNIEIGGQSCSVSIQVKQLLNNSPDVPPIGSFYQGGRIAYIFQQGDTGYIEGETHGIIMVDPYTLLENNATLEKKWGCMDTLIQGADGKLVGTGEQNTIDILAGCKEEDIAARVLENLVLNGYDDWILPSRQDCFYLQMAWTSLFLTSSLQLGDVQFWTSTQYDANKAVSYIMPSGISFAVQKDRQLAFFPVRYF